jgi:hypothetical protein
LTQCYATLPAYRGGVEKVVERVCELERKVERVRLRGVVDEKYIVVTIPLPLDRKFDKDEIA